MYVCYSWKIVPDFFPVSFHSLCKRFSNLVLIFILLFLLLNLRTQVTKKQKNLNLYGKNKKKTNLSMEWCCCFSVFFCCISCNNNVMKELKEKQLMKNCFVISWYSWEKNKNQLMTKNQHKSDWLMASFIQLL